MHQESDLILGRWKHMENVLMDGRVGGQTDG